MAGRLQTLVSYPLRGQIHGGTFIAGGLPTTASGTKVGSSVSSWRGVAHPYILFYFIFFFLILFFFVGFFSFVFCFLVGPLLTSFFFAPAALRTGNPD